MEGVVHATFVELSDNPLSPDTSEFVELEKRIMMDLPVRGSNPDPLDDRSATPDQEGGYTPPLPPPPPPISEEDDSFETPPPPPPPNFVLDTSFRKTSDVVQREIGKFTFTDF